MKEEGKEGWRLLRTHFEFFFLPLQFIFAEQAAEEAKLGQPVWKEKNKQIPFPLTCRNIISRSVFFLIEDFRALVHLTGANRARLAPPTPQAALSPLPPLLLTTSPPLCRASTLSGSIFVVLICQTLVHANSSAPGPEFNLVEAPPHMLHAPEQYLLQVFKFSTKAVMPLGPESLPGPSLGRRPTGRTVISRLHQQQQHRQQQQQQSPPISPCQAVALRKATMSEC